MKIVIAGGSGHVGTILATALHARGDEVVVLSRQPDVLRVPWRVIGWDGITLGPWTAELEGSDVLIGLSGRSVNCRYTPENRHDILASRLVPTRLLGRAIEQAARPPHVWLQASTATIYAHRFDAPNDEATGQLGGEAPPRHPKRWGFSERVAREWEAAFAESTTPATRRVLMRSALVLSPERGGIFDVLLGLVRRGLGGRVGDGRQRVSWIHERDFVRAVQWLIERDDVEGPVNLAAPHPVTNDVFQRSLREAAGIPFGLPAAGWVLRFGTWLMRTESELVLKSRYVVPGRLLANGFRFDFPDWPEAARDLVDRWKAARHRPAPEHPRIQPAGGALPRSG